MKIACLIENLGTFGGTQKQFLRIAENLFLQGYKVEIFTAIFNKEFTLGVDKILKFNVVECSKKHNGEYAKEFLRQSKHQLTQFDWILVGDGNLIYLKYYLPEAKICWICNDAPYSHKAFVYGHGLKFRARHFVKLFLYSISTHTKIKSIDKIIVLDSKMQKAIKMRYNKYAEIIRSGIDMIEENVIMPADKIMQKYGIVAGQYILTLGIAYPYRNFEVLIRSSRFINPSLKILIIAPDYYDKAYYRKITDLASKFKNIILNSQFISEEEKYILLQNAAVFVFPNKDQTWGLAPLEAASVKTPIIISSECGVTEVLEENSALIFNPDDHKELSRKINQLYNDPSLAAMLKKNAYNLVSKELNWRNYTANIVNYLQTKN